MSFFTIAFMKALCRSVRILSKKRFETLLSCVVCTVVQLSRQVKWGAKMLHLYPMLVCVGPRVSLPANYCFMFAGFQATAVWFSQQSIDHCQNHAHKRLVFGTAYSSEVCALSWIVLSTGLTYIWCSSCVNSILVTRDDDYKLDITYGHTHWCTLLFCADIFKLHFTYTSIWI